MNSVGERLKQARTERGMTQAVLAQGLATKGFISLVERDLANCSLPKLRLFADRLGRPLSYFLPEAPSEDIQYLSKTAELALRAGETRQALKAIQEGLQLEAFGLHCRAERGDRLAMRADGVDAVQPALAQARNHGRNQVADKSIGVHHFHKFSQRRLSRDLLCTGRGQITRHQRPHKPA